MFVIGMQIDVLKNEYYALADKIEEGEHIQQNKEKIDRIIHFLVPLLNEIDSITGENEKRWYREMRINVHKSLFGINSSNMKSRINN